MENETVEVVRFVEPVSFDTEIKNAIIKTVVTTLVVVAVSAVTESLIARSKARLENRKAKLSVVKNEK